MRILNKIMALLILMIVPALCFAQEKKVDADNIMRSNGRIYVVIAVMLTILLGLTLYLVRLDRKITRLEKDNRQ